MIKKGKMSSWMRSAQWAVGKSTWGPPNAARMQSAQNLKQRKIHSFSVSLFLFSLIKTDVLLSLLLLGLSY